MPRDTQVYPSVRGGISIGPAQTPAHGTVGLVVADSADDTKPFLLTCAHVVSPNNYQTVQDDLYVPYRIHAGSRKVASFRYNDSGTRFPWLERGAGRPAEDYIAVQLDPDVAYDYGWIRDIGMVNGSANVAEDDSVKMRGAETGQSSYGTVKHVSFTSDSGMFKDCIVIVGREGADTFSQAGDSGAMVVTTSNQCVGILQGYHREAGGSLVYPIERVLERCRVRILSRPGPAMGVRM